MLEMFGIYNILNLLHNSSWLILLEETVEWHISKLISLIFKVL